MQLTNAIKKWYIRCCRYLFKRRFLTVMGGPLKGYRWTTGSSYEYLIGNYENPAMLTAFASCVKPDSVFYDLGANIGFHSLLANRYISKGKIYAFEPLPANAALFNEHLLLNKKHIHNDNIQFFPIALSDKEKEIRFSNDPVQKDGNTYVNSSPVYSDAADHIEVKVRSIDELLKDGFAAPDIIKIDVEGAEMDVLHGAVNTLQHYKPYILLATHDYHLPGVQAACVSFLKDLGYTLQHTGNYNQQLQGIDDYIAFHPDRKER